MASWPRRWSRYPRNISGELTLHGSPWKCSSERVLLLYFWMFFKASQGVKTFEVLKMQVWNVLNSYSLLFSLCFSLSHMFFNFFKWQMSNWIKLESFPSCISSLRRQLLRATWHQVFSNCARNCCSLKRCCNSAAWQRLPQPISAMAELKCYAVTQNWQIHTSVGRLNWWPKDAILREMMKKCHEMSKHLRSIVGFALLECFRVAAFLAGPVATDLCDELLHLNLVVKETGLNLRCKRNFIASAKRNAEVIRKQT